MRASSPAKKLFAVIFLAVTVGGAVVNIACQRDRLARALADFSFPAPIRKMLRQLDDVEAALSANIVGVRRFVEAHSRIQVLQGREATEDLALVRDRNGVLNYGAPFPVDTSDLHEYAARLYWLSRYATGNGSRVIYVAPPDRVLPRVSSYRRGLQFRNLNPALDSFLFYIGEYGVHYLDARSALASSGLPPSEWLFRTEDNWTPQAAFATFRSLIGEMERVYGGELDPDGQYTDPNNYDFVRLPSGFLGGLGRTTGRAFAGLDSFTAIWPKLQGEYAVE